MTSVQKFERLKGMLKEMDRVIIAFSGGVDSTFLLKTASVSCLKGILAVTGLSDSVPEEEYNFAKEFAGFLNVNHRVINTEEINNASYTDNPPDRCYYCKKELFGKLNEIAAQEDYPFVLDGTNADDALDWRPGSRAAKEERVKSPLLEVGLGKNEIREISRTLGLPTWDKPATPCLSSRFPYGQKITPEALERTGRAETFIRKYGIRDLRVRNHSDVARIEILPEDFSRITDEAARKEIVEYLNLLGFKYITLDLKGFRSGSSNEFLDIKKR